MGAELDEFNVVRKTMHTAMIAKVTKALNQKIEEGKLTKTEADAMIERMSEGPRSFGHRGKRRGFGRPCGH